MMGEIIFKFMVCVIALVGGMFLGKLITWVIHGYKVFEVFP
jgi:hypothetical protein